MGVLGVLGDVVLELELELELELALAGSTAMSSSRRAAKTECIVLRAKGGRGGEKGGRRGVGSEGLRSCERRGGRTSVCCALTVAGWWLAGRGGGANGARLRRLAVWGARGREWRAR